jgi:hypothetical protein
LIIYFLFSKQRQTAKATEQTKTNDRKQTNANRKTRKANPKQTAKQTRRNDGDLQDL